LEDTHGEEVGALARTVAYFVLGRKPQEVGRHVTVFISLDEIRDNSSPDLVGAIGFE
jgi:hypothetical protein